jgi:hypothetical protein
MSDADILVFMPARNQIDQALRIIVDIEAGYQVNQIVRTSRRVERE